MERHLGPQMDMEDAVEFGVMDGILGGYTYVLTLKFKQSKRHYTDEIIIAADKHQALKLARRLYPSASIK
jgi:hypothetical protein